MYSGHPAHGLSVVKTYQEALVQQEQRDRLARQVRAAQTEASHPGRTRQGQAVRVVGRWLKVSFIRRVAVVSESQRPSERASYDLTEQELLSQENQELP